MNAPQLEPWQDPNSPWKTQSAFFSWLRGHIRKAWTRYPVSIQFKKSKSWPNPEPGRIKRLGACSVCAEHFAISHLQVDHIIPAGSLRNWDDVGSFCRRMFPSSDHMRLVCVPCHELVTLCEDRGCTLEEAKLLKPVIAFKKLKADVQRKTLEVLDLPSGSNAEERVSIFEKHTTGR